MCERNELAYYQRVREDLIGLIPEPAGRILEMGCGTGNTLRKIRRMGLATEIWGVDQHAFEDQQDLDRFIQADLDIWDFSQLETTFDIVIAGDILEHLKDPWRVLERLRQVLHADSRLLVCVPNLRDMTVIGRLLFRGDFRYEEAGTMDRTHLRFFTRKSLVRLLEESGYDVLWANGRTTGKRRYLNALTVGMFRGLLERQCYAVARIAEAYEGSHGS